MATVRWIGTAAKVAQVNTYAFAGTWESDDVVRVAFGTKRYDFTVGSTTVTTLLDTIVAAWIALSSTEYPEFAEVTPARSGSSLQLTSKVAGRAFVCTLTPLEANLGAADAQTIEGAGTATTGTIATANAGPNDWTSIANWDTGAIPVDNDDVVIENSAVDILYGLAQSAVELTSLTIDSTYTGKIGLPKRNAGGYQEYRTDYLEIGATTITIGKGTGAGSGRIKLNLTTDPATNINIYGSGQPAETGYAPIVIKGSHATNVLTLNKGHVDIAPFAGETAQFATIRVGYVSNQAGDATLRCGPGTTLATLTQNGGDVTLQAAVTTVNKTAGTLTCIGTGAVTTLNEEGGTTYYQSSGTITTLIVGAGGTINFERDMRARTITNCTFHGKSSFFDDGETVTWTNAALFSRCGLAPGDPDGVTLRLGSNFSLQRS